MNTIKVLLVDDEALLIESLEIILSLSGRFEIIGKAKDGHEALAVLKKSVASVALVDLNMKGMGGIELIHNIKLLYPSMKILVLTTFYDEKNIMEAIANGADGYLLKDSGKEAIINGIQNLMSGQSVLDGKVMQKLSKLMLTAPQQKMELVQEENLSELTKRELEICSMVAEGYTNSQISAFLFISEGTVKNYISSIYDKTGIHDRVQLAVYLTNLQNSRFKDRM